MVEKTTPPLMRVGIAYTLVPEGGSVRVIIGGRRSVIIPRVPLKCPSLQKVGIAYTLVPWGGSVRVIIGGRSNGELFLLQCNYFVSPTSFFCPSLLQTLRP